MKSFFLLAFSFLFIAACGKDPQFLDKTSHVSSVLKGEPVAQGSELAHRVVLISPNVDLATHGPQFFGICSGVIISRRIVLTAAHCLTPNVHDLKIILHPDPRSSSNLQEDIYTVIDSSVNSKYRSSHSNKTIEQVKNNSDLALLFVDRDLQNINDSAEPNFFFKLNPFAGRMNFEDIKLIITGFGKTSALKDTSKTPYRELNGVLKKAVVSAPVTQLQKNYFALPQKDAAGVCFGDSGGPVFTHEAGRYSLFAIAIGVFQVRKSNFDLVLKADPRNECAGYGLYLNIHFYKKWIMDKMIELQKAHGPLTTDAI